MMTEKNKAFEEMLISDITIVTGLRAKGRTTDRSEQGRSNHGILYIWKGEARFWAKNDIITVGAGELVFIPKDCLYKMQYAADETIFLLIDLEIFDKNGNDVFLKSDIEILSDKLSSAKLDHLMASLQSSASSFSPTASFKKKELIYRLFGMLFQNDISFQKQIPPAILPGVILLEQNFLQNTPVNELAKICNISESSFRTIFKKSFSQSPIQYRNRLRINRAFSLLEEGSSTVSEVAFACGFENVGYFCRYYKKITGESPSETKQNNF